MGQKAPGRSVERPSVCVCEDILREGRPTLKVGSTTLLAWTEWMGKIENGKQNLASADS